MVQHTKFYELMGVEPTATPEELKKAYRRRALQLHPDKRGNSPEAQDEFTTMKNAYDVLSDPRQREIYDATGEDGLKMVNGFGEMSMEEMMAAAIGALSSMGGGAKFCLLFSITAVCAVLLLVPILWCLRVDQTVDWSWVDVFIPMWILDSIYLCATCCSVVSKDSAVDENGEPVGAPPPPSTYSRALSKRYTIVTIATVVLTLSMASLLLLKALLFVATQILIAMKLQGSIDISCVAVLSPYLALEGMLLLQKAIVAYSIYASVAATATNDKPYTVRGILVASKLTADNAQGNKTSGLLCAVMMSLVVFSPFVLLAARLEGSFSSFYVLLPWLIVAGGVVVVMWLCLCCVMRPPQEEQPTASAADVPSEEGARHDENVYHGVQDDEKV
ncbi:hypothetical protein DYB36_002632 [Aphanomyces astaci]|uniref:J domain-containing protein n=2 Tax=Aphanomyces astaci TaxID=112090 RepID=A0A396ZZX3_APHAT|nr:hypothetical protein DYB36_002632 [Aphanomyces astaci]RHZ41561.1 hypothetical protein DYB31_009568 [Aphanomyces astaci]